MKGYLTSRQLFFLTVLFLLSGMAIAGRGGTGQDDWLVFLLLPLAALPMVLLFARLSDGRELPQVFCSFAGETAGKILLLFYGLAALLISVGSLNTFLEFVPATGMLYTPKAVMALLMGLAVWWLSLGEESALGRLGWLLFPVVILCVIVSVVLAVRQLDFGAVLPLLSGGVASVADKAYTLLAIQLAPLLFLVLLLAPHKKDKKIAWPVCLGVLFLCLLMAVVTLRDIMLLGVPLVGEYRYPSYSAVSAIDYGGLAQRFEILVSGAFLLSTPLRAAVCIRFSQRALSALFPRLRGWGPAALSGVMTAAALIEQGRDLSKVFQQARSYLFIGLVLLPLLLWLLEAGKKLAKKDE